MAVAEGEAIDKRGIENAVRRALRDEWNWEYGRVHPEPVRGEWDGEDGRVPIETDTIPIRWGASEKAKLDVRAALSALTERQRHVVLLTYWEGLDQWEIAEVLNCTQENVCIVLGQAIRRMKKIFCGAYKKPPESAVGI